MMRYKIKFISLVNVVDICILVLSYSYQRAYYLVNLAFLVSNPYPYPYHTYSILYLITT